MRTILALLAVLTVSADAQTFVSYKLGSFVNVSPGVYQATTNITVATNTLLTFPNVQGTTNITGFAFAFQFPGLSTITEYPQDATFYSTPVLGPCTINCTVNASSASGTAALLLARFDNVNGNAVPGGSLVQPAGFTATVSLQTSTNLTTWTTITNASYAKTNSNRFFKTSITIP